MKAHDSPRTWLEVSIHCLRLNGAVAGDTMGARTLSWQVGTTHYLEIARDGYMNIRDIVQDDFQQIYELIGQLHELHVGNRPDIFNDVDPCNKKDLENLINDEKIIALVAEDNGKIVGFCDVTIREPSINPLLTTRIVAYMEDLFVDKNYRKSGVGRLLFEQAQRASKKKNADVMELMVWTFNISAIDFYKEMGMSTQSYIMEKKL